MASPGPSRIGHKDQEQLSLSMEATPPTGPGIIPRSNFDVRVQAPKLHPQLTIRLWQWQREPFLWRCAGNLAALISASTITVHPHAWRDAPLLRSARICSESSRAEIKLWNWGLSLFAHCALVSLGILWPTLGDWNEPPHQTTVKEILEQYTVLYYTKGDLLPLISPATAPRKVAAAGRPRAMIARQQSKPSQTKVSLARARQPIVSNRPDPDNRRQTIVQPQAPDIRIPLDVNVPNLVVMNQTVPAPPPAPRDYGRQRLSGLALPAQPPPQIPAPKMVSPPKSDPRQPELRAMTIHASDVQISQHRETEVPTFPVPVTLSRAPAPVTQPKMLHPTKSMPDQPQVALHGEMSIPSLPQNLESQVRMEDMPTLPVPVNIRRGVQESARTEMRVRAIPDAPQIPLQRTDQFMSGSSSLPTLVAVSINAPPPENEIRVPTGNRAGEFAAAPGGSSRDGGRIDGGEISGAMTAATVGSDMGGSGGLSVPGLAVDGSKSGEPRKVGETADLLKTIAPGVAADRKQLLASLARPTTRVEVPRGKPLEEEYFGPRRVYTAHVNMPNLTSRSGSWVLRFAEHQGQEQKGDLSTPFVVRKVDPAYEADAQREHIEGVILLGAVVRADGSITNVRLVRGLDSRLNLSAISAFTQWKFQPAMREGRPVELEVLVQIPFVNNY